MIHYTLNTGHVRDSPRSEVDDDLLGALDRMLEPGEYLLPAPTGKYYCAVRTDGGAMIASLLDVAHPDLDIPRRSLMVMGVAPDEEAAEIVWPHLDRHYRKTCELPAFASADMAAPRRPEAAPWCGVIVSLATPDEAYWMADFERCLAWAWISQRKTASRREPTE